MRKIAIIFTFIFLAVSEVVPISLDQGFIEKALHENRHFLKTLNISVSNMGTKRNIEDLVTAAKHDFLARIWYLQGRYPKAFNEIRKSQEIMKDTFHTILEIYLDQTREFLESYAPMVIRSRDKHSAHYLQLGFRDLKNSEDYLITGDNYSRLLFSNKIHIYMEGIKRARRGKKYAILSIIEAQTPRQEKPQFKLQTLDDVRNPETDVVKVGSYERVLNLLQNMFARRILKRFVPPPPKEPKSHILEHHDDNYAIISRTKCSVLAEYDPDFDGTKDLAVAKVIHDRDIVIELLEKETAEKAKEKAAGKDPDKDSVHIIDDKKEFVLGCRPELLPESVKADKAKKAAAQPADKPAGATAPAAAPTGGTNPGGN